MAITHHAGGRATVTIYGQGNESISALTEDHHANAPPFYRAGLNPAVPHILYLVFNNSVSTPQTGLHWIGIDYFEITPPG